MAPDQAGDIHGIGFDVRTYAPLVPAGILAPGDALADGQPGAWRDFISYCANDANCWNSVRGWNETLWDL